MTVGTRIVASIGLAIWEIDHWTALNRASAKEDVRHAIGPK
jgi:type IV secretory pathway TrbD component